MKVKTKFLFLAVLIFSSMVSAQEQKYESHSICTAISAAQAGVNSIKLTWNLPSKNFHAASIAIFRDTKQITATSSILSQKPIADVPAKTTSYTDEIENYGEYYYALVARTPDGKLYNIIVPSANATVNSVNVKKPESTANDYIEEEKLYYAGQLRNLPLPYLDIIEDLDIKPTNLNPKATSIAKELSGDYSEPRPKVMEPYVFEKDIIEPTTGDDYYLFEILKDSFINKEYKKAAIDLKKLLSINRDDDVTNRAIFYLAEAQYFCKNYKEALTLFLFIEDDLPELSKKWIDSTLDLYKMPVITSDF